MKIGTQLAVIFVGLLHGTADVAVGLDGLETFAPGVVSSDAIEDAIAFSPDGQLAVFARRAGSWGGPPERGTLYQTRRQGTRWTTPRPLPFSGHHDDGDPSFSPDGRRLFFVSSRPNSGGRQDSDIWVVERMPAGWGEPRHLGDGVNSPAAEYSPAVAASGRLYFASMRDGGYGQGDLYVAEPEGDGFSAPRNLGPVVNSAQGEWNLTVAADESFLVFEASGRPTNRSVSGDLYVAYRSGGEWMAPVPLDAVNTEQSELNARVDRDGERFYFAQSTPADKGRHADIRWIAVERVLPHRADPRIARAAVVSRSAHEVFVLEAGSWRTLYRLPVGHGPHEIAISADRRRAYTADYGQFPVPHQAPIAPGPVQWVEAPSAQVTVIDLEGMRRLDTLRIDGCSRNHGILAARDGLRLWTTCEVEGSVLELDARSGATLRRFDTAIGSHQLLATPDETLLLVSNVESGSVSLIALADGTVRTLPTGRGAEGLAISPDGRRLWVGNGLDDTLSIVDLEAGRVSRTIPSGGRFPVKLAFSADGRSVQVVNTASRSIVVFDADELAPLRTHEFESPPLGILALPAGDRTLVTFPRRNEVAVISAEGSRIASVPGIIEADGIGWIAARSP
ncbi:MAG: beta-propeller fold lactonase family protein [Steroidobacteraceae bacterium]